MGADARQDTLISEDMFDTRAHVYDESGRRSPLIGSNYMGISSKRQIVYCDPGDGQGFQEQRAVINLWDAGESRAFQPHL